ncbi:MAG: aldo/keto reductase, partial [Victivallaceae bacterium]
MIYKEYGRTGKKVSAVGFGGMRFNLEKSLEENAELLHYASGKGINYFDTAPGYCDDKSEDIFGIAFKSMPRNKFFVSTKLMPMHVKNAQETYDKVRTSLERLNVDKIDFFHVWCLRKMEHYHDAMRPDGMYEALRRCQTEGLIEH